MARARGRVGGAVLCAAILAAGLGLVAPAPPVAAAPGPVGPTFGTSGLVVTPLRPDSTDFANAVAVLPTGETIAAGGAGGDFGLVKYGVTLGATNSFGFGEGTRVTDFGGTYDEARAVTVTASGHVVAAGAAGADLAVARYDEHGILDRSFDGDGRLTVDLGGPADSAWAIVPSSDDGAVVVGGNQSSVVLLRLLPDGHLDPTFGTAGRVTVPAPGPGRAATVQPDGKLLVAGGGDRFTAYRFLPDGALDPAFGQAGTASVGDGPATANAVVLGPDGAITLGGTRGTDVAVARLGPSGQPDPAFGSGGVTVSDFGAVESGYGLARRSDGGIMLVGESGKRGLLVAYGPDGSLDASFGDSGHQVTTPDVVLGRVAVRLRAVMFRSDGTPAVVGAVDDNAYVGYPQGLLGATADFGNRLQKVVGSVVQPDGKIVALAQLGNDTALVRYNPDGTRDGGFGIGGVVTSDQVSVPRALALQPGGRIVVAGIRADSTGRTALIGFRPDGSLDTAFGADRGIGTQPGVDPVGVWTLSATPDGRLVAVVARGDAVMLDRFTESGAPDPSFAQEKVIDHYLAVLDRPIVNTALQPDGRIVVAGIARDVVRLNADGSRDLSFGTGGQLQPGRPTFGQPRAVAVQPDGRILVGGIDRGSLSVLRLLPDGSDDPAWQRVTADFHTLINGPTYASEAVTFTVQPDGTILVSANANGGLGIVKLRADGTHDASFGTDGLSLLPMEMGADPVLVVQTASSGMVALATAGSAAYPTSGVMLARVATGALGVPTSVTAVAGAGSARVRWSSGALFPDSPVLAYRVTASDGIHSATTRDAAHLSAVVTGLTTGRPYTFTVRAVRVAGDGPPSAPSGPVTPGLSSPTSAWGWNAVNQLGDGTAIDRLTPAVGVAVPGAIALAAGAFHSVALRADGTVWTWGWNGYGELGDGTTTSRPSPVQVPGLTNVTAIAAGPYQNLALKADGTVWGWGWNGWGQLGTGTIGENRLVPTQVQGLAGVTGIAAGFYHSLAVRSDGTVFAWGWNAFGQLGDGTIVDSTLPRQVPGLSGITAVAGGALHSVALGRDGAVRTWGWNGLGQLGAGDTVDRRTPYTVSLGGVVSIAAGAYHNYALLQSGTLSSWGWNGFGQLGTVAPGGTWPMSVDPLDDVVSVAAGWLYGLAVRADGSVVAWGDNRYGQLGDGTLTSRTAPRAVRVPSALAVAGGALHSLSA